jgi:1,4-alpha-glucan branching enzyme
VSLPFPAHDPHATLGAHPDGCSTVLRAWQPGARRVSAVLADGREVVLEPAGDVGLFEGRVPGPVTRYVLSVDGEVVEDPYRFWPTLGELDLHLLGEGRHRRLWERLGAHVREHQGVRGTSFAVWAPNARSVRVVGDWNGWDGRRHPMRVLGASGVWELFVPGVGPGARYKFEVHPAEGPPTLRADPFAFATECPPATASIVWETTHRWRDAAWLARRAGADPWHEPLAIYEVHAGSWRWVRDEGAPGGWRPMTYVELGRALVEHLARTGFTHVELLPVAEHPYGGSWGYQVTSYFAPTARYGTPDDFREMVDVLHEAGFGVIVDWVPAHFPRDAWALARFDGTALYEHADPRQGEHPDWGTLVFNYGRNEVRNFLLASALWWLEELHVDGLRVDAVASMLYLDYSRGPGEWVPNRYGGRENLEAIAFLRELNEVVHERVPGVLMIAEESTAWPGVSRPVHLGGLGFGFKWNMGWMHDTLTYFRRDPVHRRHHHHELTFGLLYAFSENFVLPLSHDEVVHGKGSLLAKLPGDRWQRFANLRALLAWMWAHPGKKLLFMGGEIAQEREWSADRSLDWHLLDQADHRGVHDLVAELNRVYRDAPALWERDVEPEGFAWIEADDADASVYAFCRFAAGRRHVLVCVANLTPVPRPAYRVGLPAAGRWEVLVDTDDVRFGGSGYRGAVRLVDAVDEGRHGLPASAALDLPPLAVLWLAPGSEGALS